MSMSGLVSIITTVYNREKHLLKAIESVLTQTYSDFELIIWNDGSTDSSDFSAAPPMTKLEVLSVSLLILKTMIFV